MAKKSNLGKIFNLVTLGCAVLTIVMLFLPMIVAGEGDNAVTYNAFAVSFGYTAETKVLGSTVSTEVLDFSFMNFLTVLLTVAGTVCAVLTFLKGGNLFSFIAAACFVVAGIFFFCALGFTAVHVGDLTGNAAELFVNTFKNNSALGIGAILGGVFAIIGGASQVVKAFVK